MREMTMISLLLLLVSSLSRHRLHIVKLIASSSTASSSTSSQLHLAISLPHDLHHHCWSSYVASHDLISSLPSYTVPTKKVSAQRKAHHTKVHTSRRSMKTSTLRPRHAKIQLTKGQKKKLTWSSNIALTWHHVELCLVRQGIEPNPPTPELSSPHVSPHHTPCRKRHHHHLTSLLSHGHTQVSSPANPHTIPRAPSTPSHSHHRSSDHTFKLAKSRLRFELAIRATTPFSHIATPSIFLPPVRRLHFTGRRNVETGVLEVSNTSCAYHRYLTKKKKQRRKRWFNYLWSSLI